MSAEVSHTQAQMGIQPIPTKMLRIPIVGVTPLIMHRFSEKAKQQMLDNMQGRKKVKANKDPEAEYQAAFYRLKEDVYGFPATAFKLATVGAARFYDKSVTMTSLRQAMFFKGEMGEDGMPLVRIDGEPIMREDVVRVGQGGTDLRYRPQFNEWSTTLEIIYVTTLLDAASVVSLVDAGGLGVGIGEWRPEKKGDFGTYRVDPTRDVEVDAQ